MKPSDFPVVKDIVLVGGGHSHVGVLRRFGMQPQPGVRLTVIGTDTHTPYSGMLPGYVSGLYTHDEVHLDLSRLASYAGARYFRDEVIGLDREARLVLCRNRPPVPYDVVSINTGSTPMTDRVPGASEHAVAVKPVRGFTRRWQALLERAERGETLRMAVVGAGAGGVELLLAMQHRLHTLQGRTDRAHFALFSADKTILPTHNARVRGWFTALLAQRQVAVHLGAEVSAVQAGALVVNGVAHGPFDDIVWVTQAAGPAWLAKTGLALDERGFVQVNAQLQSLSDPRVFAAGDVAAMVGHRLEKAGVFAVRQGKPLAENLRRAVQGRPLQVYRPQRTWLALIGTGGREAIASKGPWAARGGWLWHWKEWIDRRFMARFTDLKPMPMPTPAAQSAPPALDLAEEDVLQLLAAETMRCGGCGAKVGASVLSRALATLYTVPNPDVLLGLDAADDAAVVRVPPGQLLVQTIDFFRAFIDDPYLLGRIAANHALGDVYAMGAQPHTATAVATVPPGLESKVEDTVRQMMTGAVEVLNAAGCTLVGGHTGEGRELALGFALNGLLPDSPGADRGWMSKGGLRVGDRLVLTKPIGTGIVLVGHARLLARGAWVDAALDSMQRSPRNAARTLQAHGAAACTDVTGFGLLGHALEMAKASTVGLQLHLDAVPLLDGALALAEAGLHSSLQPANLRLRRAIANQAQAATHPVYPLMFDPQTAGGLLAGVPAEAVQACLAELHRQGDVHACVIGDVVALADPDQALTLLP